eukprot:720381-Karenia_brevis.AAC.1
MQAGKAYRDTLNAFKFCQRGQSASLEVMVMHAIYEITIGKVKYICSIHMLLPKETRLGSGKCNAG